jgi:predicted transcriptional regulator
MLAKTTVLDTIQQMPNEFSLDDLMERLILIKKVEKGLQQVKEGKTYSHEEAKKWLAKWLN